jgi:hypothetical protein
VIAVINLDGRTRVTQSNTYKITVQIPQESAAWTEELTPDLMDLIPETGKRMCRLEVHLPPGAHSSVKGYGMPFSHSGEQIGDFLTQNAPHDCGLTLVEILQQRNFTFLVAAPSEAMQNNWNQPLPPPPRYPYGEEHHWSVDRYEDILPENKGSRFTPAWSFDNDNEHLAALSHSQAQDIMWIYNAAQEMSQQRFRAYFVQSGDEDLQTARDLLTIVPLGRDFLTRHEQAWRRLVDSGFVTFRLHNEEDLESPPAEWKARIVDTFSNPVHPVDQNDLVLRVRRPPPTSIQQPNFVVRGFRERNHANREGENSWNCVSLFFDDLLHDYERKVDGVNELRPRAQASNPVVFGVSTEEAGLARATRSAVRPDIKFKMDLHRAMVRNNGYFEVLAPVPIPEQVNDDGDFDELSAAMANAQLEDHDEVREVRSLPVFNFLAFNPAEVEALLEQALPADRPRLLAHLSKVYLGFILVTAVSKLLFTFLPSLSRKLQ